MARSCGKDARLVFLLNYLNANFHQRRQIAGKRVVLVVVDVLDRADTRCQHHPCADNTRIVRYVGRAVFATDSAACTVGDGVLFGVHGCLFVAIPHNRLMVASWEESVIALADNAVVAHQETSDLETFAGAAGGRCLYDCLEVVVPGGAGGHLFTGHAQWVYVAHDPVRAMLHPMTQKEKRAANQHHMDPQVSSRQ